MATLVLSTVGAIVAGPIGSAVGAMIGQQIDQRLFAPKGRKGPRLGELAVQTSSYGSAIPKLFGTMRVAGTVIWSTDLKEDRHKSGGGKGRPKTTTYSYSASFAVALSARPIRAVRRIWADGKLLRGAAGDFKSETGFRLYLGDEQQEADPIIASREGAALSPAYRGLAYAVFEDFQLADYGNRIPLLTFEVEADGGPVAIGRIAAALSGGAVADGSTIAVAGYAASGDSVRAAVEALADVIPLSLSDDAGALVLRMTGFEPVDVPAAAVGAKGAGDSGGPTDLIHGSGDATPGEVSLSYYEPARDYQTGLQRAIRNGAERRTDARALAAALDAETAKALAEHRLAALWIGRSTARVHLPWRWETLKPGRAVRLQGHPGQWRVTRWTLDRLVVSLELVRERGGLLRLPSATPGRSEGQPDFLHGPTTLRLFELPSLTEPPHQRPILFAAAAGTQAGWRRAALSASYDGGASWEAVGVTAAPATLGSVSEPLHASGSALLDAANSLEVELHHEGMWLEGRDDDALAAGQNLALVGAELIQFGQAEPVGPRRFRLSRLLRGRGGTEWAAGAHQAGEPFTLIEAESLTAIELPPGLVGSEARLLALGIGDSAAGVEAAVLVNGEGLRPPSPVHLRAVENADGGLRINWVRRSRLGWSWPGGVDAPLAEEAEKYRVTVSGGGVTRVLELTEARLLYTAPERAEHAGTVLKIEVVQLGTHGPSRSASLIV